MSHVVTVKTQFKDIVAIKAACQRLGLAEPVYGTAQLYSDAATGLQVKLPGWRYMVVIDTATGEAKYDNFSGNWGHQKEFDKFACAYSVEKTKIEARKNGYTVSEQPLADGSVKLQLRQL